MDDKKSLIEKIQALMAITIERGATPNEAEIAARKINELLLKYNLSLSQVQGHDPSDDEMVRDFLNVVDRNGKEKYGHTLYWMASLAIQIGEQNFCYAWMNEQYDNTVSYVGTRSDVETATYIFHATINLLYQQADIEYKKFVQDKFGGRIPKDKMYGDNHPTVWRNSWMEGAGDAIESAIRKENFERKYGKNKDNSAALVIQKEERAKEWYWEGRRKRQAEREEKEKQGLIKSRKKREYKEAQDPYRQHSQEAYRRGQESGSGIKVNKGVGGAERKKIR